MHQRNQRIHSGIFEFPKEMPNLCLPVGDVFKQSFKICLDYMYQSYTVFMQANKQLQFPNVCCSQEI